MATPGFTTYNFSTELHGHLIPYIAALHASCMTGDQMAGPFVPPLTNEKLLPWWKERIAESHAGTRVIVLLLPADAAPGYKPQGTDFRGLAMLKADEAETGAFRCRVDCVLVNRGHRRQGGAKALVQALEYEAGKRGRTLLLADTETGSPAEAAFKKFGYTEIGKVPRYNRTATSAMKDETFFYKDLLPAPEAAT